MRQEVLMVIIRFFIIFVLSALVTTGANGAQKRLKSNTVGNVTSFLSVSNEVGGGGYQNSIDIDSIRFDSSRGIIYIDWCVDTAALAHDVEMGVSYSLEQFSYDPTNISAVVPTYTECSRTVISLREPLLFDTLYFITLWFRTAGSAWLDPTFDSRDTVRTGHPFRQIVTFFDSSETNDTVQVFNGSALLWKDAGYDKSITIDTLEIINFDPATTPPGMVITGQPFFFKIAAPALPFYIGIKVGNLPDGKTLADVRIYNMDEQGLMHVDYATQIDHSAAIAYIKTSTLRRSFIAAVDTARPIITVYSDTTSFVTSSSCITDSIGINDNITNAGWSYYFGKGDETPLLRANGIMVGSPYSFSVTIPDTLQAISSESGLRALLVITDGANKDTVDLSRSVLRYESDNITTIDNTWTPISPTADLFYRSPDSLLARLSNQDSSGYDTRYVRLYRWVDWEGNTNSDEKWVEYNPDSILVRSLFNLRPGRLLWLKTRGNIALHLDSGTTLSLKDTFALDLPSRQWIDFGMPYRFGVTLERILATSGESADSVLFYRWEKDITGTYSLVPWYVPGLPDHADRSRCIEYAQAGGYSFYNRKGSTLRLLIPPYPEQNCTPFAATKKRYGDSWSVKFMGTADNGYTLPPVYVGYAPGIQSSSYPCAPSFSTLRAFVFDRSTGERYGHYIGSDAAGGIIKEILISNDGDNYRTIRYQLEKSGIFPVGYNIASFNPVLGKIEHDFSIVIAPHGTASRIIIAGNDSFHLSYCNSVIPLTYKLHTPAINNSMRSVAIRYTVPAGSRAKLRFAVYSMLGKRIWDRKIDGLQAEGMHQVVWNGHDNHNNAVSSGLYIIRLSVIDGFGKDSKRFERRCTLIR